jgi:hypothetical protein
MAERPYKPSLLQCSKLSDGLRGTASRYLNFRKLFIRNFVAANPLTMGSDKKLSKCPTFQGPPVLVKRT